MRRRPRSAESRQLRQLCLGHSWKFRLLLCGLVTAGCSCLHTHPCSHRKDPVGETQLLEKKYSRETVRCSTRTWTVFVATTPVKHGPPVLLLHEMPALSADILDLGLRLRDDGFTVYVPLLFGGEKDNSQSTLLFLRRAIAMRSDPEWLTGKGDAPRRIVDEIAELCRECILRRHHGERLGVIGNCVTGSIPIALLAKNLPEFVAPAISQPALPMPACSQAAKQDIGISPKELLAAQERVRHDDIEIIGFRFQYDGISPSERFVAFRRAFTFGSREYFIDRTLPKIEYFDQDRLDLHSHSVLAGCYHAAKHSSGVATSSTQVAWLRLTNFLHAKLDGPAPRPYVEKFPKRLIPDPSNQ